jgi:hypothetical protein
MPLILLLPGLPDLLTGINAERCGNGYGDGGDDTDAPMLHGALLWAKGVGRETLSADRRGCQNGPGAEDRPSPVYLPDK